MTVAERKERAALEPTRVTLRLVDVVPDIFFLKRKKYTRVVFMSDRERERK